MKKLLIILGLMLLMVASVSAFSGSGAGTLGDPYVITTCSQLQEMNDELDANYILDDDIDCSETISWNGGNGFFPVGYYENDTWTEYPFTGVFDGKNHTISDLFMDWQTNEGVYLGGLFGYTVGADIRNVGLTDVDITVIEEQWGSVGGFGGQNSNTDFTNVFVKGYLEGSYTIGGISGEISGTCNILNSYADITAGINQISPAPDIGGILGYSGNCNIDDSYTILETVDINNVDAIIYPIGRTTAAPPILTNVYFDCTIYGSDCGTEGKTTAEMQTAFTFSAWDTSIWNIGDGSYPEFNWEVSNTPPVINSISPNERIELTSGETQLYTADVTDAELDASYSWTIGSTEVSTTETYLADWGFIEPGIYTLTLTVDDGTYQDSDSVILEIRAKSSGGGSLSIVSDPVTEPIYEVTAEEADQASPQTSAFSKFTGNVGSFFSSIGDFFAGLFR